MQLPGWRITSLGLFSLTLFVGCLLAVPWLLKRLPADFFIKARPASRWRLPRNILGALLVVAGAAMLVLPGQGVLTIVVGLSLIDHPRKGAAMRRLLQWGPARNALQAGRRAVKAPPLVLPE
jgi:hypothetical protein